MKNFIQKQLIILTVIALVLSSSCVNLAKRFKSQKTRWVSTTEAKKYVEVQAEAFNIVEPAKTPTSTKDLYNLFPEGQAELIKSIGAKTKDVDELVTGLSKKLSSENSSMVKVKVFPTKISKSILFSVDRLWASEGYAADKRIINRVGDRLSNLEVSLNIPKDKSIQFNSWDKFVTDWVTVDLGKVTSSQQWSATGNVSYNSGAKLTNSDKSTSGNTSSTKIGKADVGQSETTDGNSGSSEKNKGSEISTGVGGSASVNFTDKYETSLNLLLSRMKLSGTLSKDKITLRQEGAFGIDLSGNTAISVDITFSGGYATPIYVFKVPSYYEKGIPIPALTINRNTVMWVFPDVTNTVTATLQYKYLYRHVKKLSKKHIPEARQRISNYYGEVGYGKAGDKSYVAPVDVELIKPDDFKPTTFRVGLTSNSSITYINWDSEIADFETSTEAAAFLEYLISLSKTTKTYGTITNIPTDHNFKSCKVMKFQN